MSARYARQVSVLGIGAAGQEAIGCLEVAVSGPVEPARVAALYLAGAGVARLRVPSELVARVSAQNALVEVIATSRESQALEVELLEGSGAPAVHREVRADPVEAGARAARWVLARALGSTSR